MIWTSCAVPIRNEHILVRKLLEQLGRLAEVRRQYIGWIRGDPLRQINRRVNACVESNQHAALLVADVFDRMSVALWDIAYVSLRQGLGPVAAVGTEHRHTDFALDDILPLVGRWMPMQLTQAARLQVEN